MIQNVRAARRYHGCEPTPALFDFPKELFSAGKVDTAIASLNTQALERE